MSSEAFLELVIAFSTGLGMLVFGLAAIVVGMRSWLPWGANTLVAAGVAGLGPVAFDVPELAPISAAAVLLIVLVVKLLGSQRFASAFAAVYRRAASPAGVVSLLVTAGAVLMAGSLVRHTIAEQADMDRDDRFMALTLQQPKTLPVDGVELRTDNGMTVQALVAAEIRSAEIIVPAEREVLDQQSFRETIIRTGPASDACNCHGWVFTGGHYWVSPDAVERILSDNAYEPVSDPQPNDIVVYRKSGVITHTAVVRSATPGWPVLVEGKWGWMGVFIHEVGASFYGQQYTFHRSPRNGHLLAEGAIPTQTIPGTARRVSTD
jgi:hypothetical protein